MIMKHRNCIIGQSGGPTAAINASLAGVIHKALESGSFSHVYGMINGIEGLLSHRYMDLSTKFGNSEMIHQLIHTPAMYLGSCRYKLPELPSHPSKEVHIEEYDALFSFFEELSITDFFYIGGNDSMDTVMKLSAYGRLHDSQIHFIGIPKTIDNDLYGTDHTPGFGSAAKYVATSMMEIIHDSLIYNQKSVTIVEVMGRNAGWLTAATALARTDTQIAPDLIYLPEMVFDIDKFLRSIQNLFKTRRNIIVAVSEGVRDSHGNFLDDAMFGQNQDTVQGATEESIANTDVFGHVIHSGTGKVLENIIRNTFGCKCRSIELNVLQRCAMHVASKTDLSESFEVGSAAVLAALKDKNGVMMTMQRTYTQQNEYKMVTGSIDVNEVANIEHKIPIEWITPDGDDITEQLYNYLYPLIQGEVNLSYKHGIPSYLDVSHLL